MIERMSRRGAGRGLLRRTATVTAIAVSFLLLPARQGAAERTQRLGSIEVSSLEHSFRVVQVATGLRHPWSVAFLPGGDILVTQRSGTLLRVGADGRKRLIRGLPPVAAIHRGGLLDLALSPGFADDRLLYFSYTEKSRLPWLVSWRGTWGTGGSRKSLLARLVWGGWYRTAVARAELAGDRLVSVRRIFAMNSFLPTVEGFGSRLAFLPDGDLLVTVGDRKERHRAQDPSDHAGSVLRIRPDGSPSPRTAALAIPGAAPEVFTFGHRDPQGLAVHPVTGAIWSHEHGQQGGDEVNVLRGGANYGWPVATYSREYPGEGGGKIGVGSEAPGMEPPLLHWTPAIAPSGMAFYTGTEFPRWRGNLFVGSLAGRHLRRIVVRGREVVAQEVLLKDRLGRIRDVRQGPDGRLWLLPDHANAALYRIEPSAPHLQGGPWNRYRYQKP